MVLGVSDEDSRTVADYAANNKLGFPVASVPRAPEPFGGLEAIPVTFVLDAGVVREVLEGYQERAALRKAVEAAKNPLTALEGHPQLLAATANVELHPAARRPPVEDVGDHRGFGRQVVAAVEGDEDVALAEAGALGGGVRRRTGRRA